MLFCKLPERCTRHSKAIRIKKASYRYFTGQFYSLEQKRRRQNDMLSKYTSLVTLPTLDHKPSNDMGHVIKHGLKVCTADILTVKAIISYISSVSLLFVADILDYAQRRTIQQVSSLHLFSFLVVSCLIFEIERGFG